MVEISSKDVQLNQNVEENKGDYQTDSQKNEITERERIRLSTQENLGLLFNKDFNQSKFYILTDK